MENKKMTTPIVSVGADTEQLPNVCNDSITDFNEDGKSLDDYLEEMQKEFSKQMSPSYLKTVSMSELYDTVFNVQTPLIDGLLQRGTYIFAGSPKVGKSFMMVQLAYHISTGTPLWGYKVQKSTVLYFALEDDYPRLQERNPNLKVFSAHLHIDEATPHLHIDFVPFTTGSKRGLDTRVSLKQALAAQGFKGGTRGDTEWNQWVSAEKSALAFVMERHGIEWEHKGTHEKHLSVLDYKKQEREKEIAVLDNQLAEKKDEFRVMADRIENFDNGEKSLQKLDESIMNEPEYQLPEPPAMMLARTYKAKFVEPLISRFKSLISTLFARYFKALDSYHRLNITNGNLYRANERLEKINDKLTKENTRLRAENKDYSLLRKVFGHKQIDDLLERARNVKGRKRDDPRSR